MPSYYNEIDPFACAWLEELRLRGEISDGTIDERDIRDVKATDVAGHGRRHFFAGIGGWDLALRLAGVDEHADIWTGSCPCQPFSQAGRRGGAKGIADERHLWPEWFRIIRECLPPLVFGEQVSSPPGLAWFDAVSRDLEAAGYAVAASDLCAPCVGAPHIRQRLYFVAMADSDGARSHVKRIIAARNRDASSGHDANGSRTESVAYAPGARRQRTVPVSRGRSGSSDDRRMGDTRGKRSGRDTRALSRTEARSGSEGFAARGVPDIAIVASASDPRSAWQPIEWLECSDGKSRPIKPGLEPLAYGVPNRVGRCRGYGNAIVPQLAAEFIRAAIEALATL